MKSSLKISVAAIGLVSSILVSAAASPATEKINSVDYIVESKEVIQGQNEFFEEIEIAEIGNDCEILTVENEKVKPTKVEKKPVSSQVSSNKVPQSSQQSKPQSSAPQSSQTPSAGNSTSTATPAPTVSMGTSSIPPSNSNTNGEILKFKANSKNYSMDVKEALKGIVANEVNEQFSYEAIKAQVVAAHTFVKYYNDQGSYASVGYKSYTKGGKIDRAVEEVYKYVMTFNGKTIYSPYHAISAGRTQSSQEVWGGARAYLVAAESKYDYLADYYNLSSGAFTSSKIKSNFLKTTVLSESTVKSKIQNKLGVTPSGDPSTWFQFLDANNGGVTSGGYVNKIIVAGKQTKGTTVRTMLNLRSAAFEISYANGYFTITTKGYGHGVGLSQWGAHFYALKDGWNYAQILCHYYTGVTITEVK